VSGSLQDRARAISGTLALDTKAIADSSLAFFFVIHGIYGAARRGAENSNRSISYS
jgi:hypothetical protein